MKTIAEALDKAGVQAATDKPKAKAKAKASKPEVTPVTTAATWREALSNVLMTVPKAAHKVVTDTTEHIVKSVQARAKNEFSLGAECRKVQAAISKDSFSRWLYEVVQRVGISRATIYRYMDQSDVLSSRLPFDPAREALIGVTGGRGLFKREDGTATLHGHVEAALRKIAMPTSGDYESCLDWAHMVQVAIEQGQEPGGKNAGEMSKAIRNQFTRLLKKNVKFAASVLVECYKLAYATSEPLANDILDGIEKVNLEFETLSPKAVKTTTETTRERAIA